MTSHSIINAQSAFTASPQSGDPEVPTPERARACLVVVRMRTAAAKLLGNVLSGDPYWDALLDIYLAEAQDRSVYQSAIRIRELSQPSAHRHSAKLEQLGAVFRVPDTSDYRRRKLVLTADVRRAIDEVMDFMVMNISSQEAFEPIIRR